MPHLFSVSWAVRSQWPRADRPDLRVFVSTKLRHFTWTHISQSATVDLVTQLQDCAPTMRTLKMLELEPVTSKVQERLCRFICSQPNLHSVHILPLLPSAFQYLSSLNSLEHLTFQMADIDYARILQAPAHTPPFRCLRGLSIITSAHASNSLISFIKELPRKTLVSFTLTYSSLYCTSPTPPVDRSPRPDAQQLQSLLAVLATFDSLQSITLQQRRSAPLSASQMQKYTLCDDDFSPLYANARLTSLIIANIPCEVSPAALETMARAWPALRELSLGLLRDYSRAVARSSPLTLEDLLPLCTQHETLEQLGVVIRPSETNGEFSWPGPASSLKQLRLQVTEVMFAHLIGGLHMRHILQTVFPRTEVKWVSSMIIGDLSHVRLGER